jgi:DEAD/DEAH box helicase domain-containing protein
MKTIVKCPCESGCPSCVHSPKCGSGNRPIDKTAAIFILDRIQDVPKPDGIQTNGVYSKAAKGRYNVSVAERSNSLQGQEEQRIALNHVQDTSHRQTKKADLQNIHFGVFDIETQRSAQEVGGWHRADLMGISCAVLYDSKKDTFFEFLEDQVPMLIEHMRSLDLIVGFNIKRFDYHVLDGYSEFDFRKLPTLDILEEIHKHLGYRLSLDHLARVNLKIKKSADGLQALRWWKQGLIREIIDYCKHDVAITRDLFILGKKNKYLLFNNKAGNTVRIPVRW